MKYLLIIAILCATQCRAQQQDTTNLRSAGKYMRYSLDLKLASLTASTTSALLYVNSKDKTAAYGCFAIALLFSAMSYDAEYKAAKCLKFTGTGVVITF